MQLKKETEWKPKRYTSKNEVDKYKFARYYNDSLEMRRKGLDYGFHIETHNHKKKE